MNRLGYSDFSDVDQLGGLVGWDLHFRQINAGRFSGFVDIVGNTDLIVMRVSFSQRLHQVGQPIQGMKSFAWLETDCAPLLNWCSGAVDTADIIDFNDPGGFDGVSDAGHKAYTFSLSDSLLGKRALELGIDYAECFGESHNGLLLNVDPALLGGIKSAVERAFTVADSPDPALRVLLGEEIQASLVDTVLVLTADRCSVSNPIKLSARQRLCRKAVQLVNDRIKEPLSVADLCRESGTSVATLERAFKEAFGITPKRYIDCSRMNAVRKAIVEGHADTITSTASSYGYWHMGKFAMDYKRFTGALPSAEFGLRKASRHAV